ncbi:MAG TPA: hypothetical protein VMJ70_03165 [Candidatus Sulfotelmatobacter sp.]|nr:hypothetical protein [Candidatus Sulfotelmatobacter sp.]
MRLSIALCALVCIACGVVGSAGAQPVQQRRGYVLRDTTSLPPPDPGMARLVVARDMQKLQDLKPEFVFVDRTPFGILAQSTAVTGMVTPGWHRVWLGRAGQGEVWVEFVAGGGCLLRLRETMMTGVWHGDLVREGAEGYAHFALKKGLKLSVMDSRGRDALARNMAKPGAGTAAEDSVARERAMTNAVLPIVIKEAWYLPIPSDAHPGEWENHPGTLTIDEKSVRYTQADSLVLEIPRESVTSVYFGAQKGDHINPWIKVGYKEGDLDRGATFADANESTATENYNRIFGELAKRLAPR